MKSKIFKSVGALFVAAMTLTCSSCDDFLSAYSQDKVVAKNVTHLDELMLGSVYVPSYAIVNGPTAFITCGFNNILDDDVNTGRNASAGGTADLNAWRNCLTNTFGYFAWQLNVGDNFAGTNTAEDNYTWNDLYARINVVNVILDEIIDLPHTTEADDATYYRVQGEAHFARAQFYFTLANLYGPAFNPMSCTTDLCVPLKLTPYVEHDKTKPTQFSRATVAQVYEQIEKDLLEAEALLTRSPQNENHRLHRASLESVDLLLSRVYLYMQKWQEAEQKADAVINNKVGLRLATADMLTEGNAFLTADNPEIIFSQGSNTVSTSAIFNARTGDYCVTRELYDLYTEGDMRPVCFFNTSRNDSIGLATKYAIAYGDRARIGDVFMMRLAEAYLNKAEACAMQSKDAEANAALTEIRIRRIVNYTPTNYSGADLVNEIRNERRKELCFEGHRWFDLRRYAVNIHYPFSKKIVHVLNIINDLSEYVSTRYYILNENDDAYTFSIPKSVLEFDEVQMPNNPRQKRNASKNPGENASLPGQE